MKRKLGICTVISFVFAGLSAPAFLFSVYFLATYCIGGTPTGDGQSGGFAERCAVCHLPRCRSCGDRGGRGVRGPDSENKNAQVTCVLYGRMLRARRSWNCYCQCDAASRSVLALEAAWYHGYDRYERDSQHSILAAVFNLPGGRRHPCDTRRGIARIPQKRRYVIRRGLIFITRSVLCADRVILMHLDIIVT